MPAGTPRRIGKFELLEQLGVGGFGAVYKARDTELERTVAIKLPRPGSLQNKEDIKRFLKEARSAAQLQHPSIVTVYDAGQEDDICWLVSEYVQGETLADRLQRNQFSFRDAALLVAEMADAIHFANERGVVHRDLKPSNVMLDMGGRPHIMDFGLAKRAVGETTVTIAGEVLGTPAYMSPEQAKGESHTSDARSDVYSLGVILYEMLTGELPFKGNKRMLIVQVLQDEPRPPRRLNDSIPRDLDTICLKCMMKSKAMRFTTAKELADDLHRFVKGEPIVARPISTLNRTWRWCQRNRRVASLLALSAILVAMVVVVTAVSSVVNSRALFRERAARQQLEKSLYLNRINQSLLHYRANDLAEARSVLEQAIPESGESDRRGWEWYYLNAVTHAASETKKIGNDGAEWVNCVSFSSDGRYLAAGAGAPHFENSVAGTPGSLAVWDLETGRTVIDLHGKTLSIASLAFSPDGRRIAAADQDVHFKRNVGFAAPGSLRIWDIATAKELPAIDQNKGTFFDVAFSPKGGYLAANSVDGVCIWHLKTGDLLHTIADTSLWRFSDEDRFITINSNGQLTERQVRDETLIKEIRSPPDGQQSLDGKFTFSSDGKLTASITKDRDGVNIVDTLTGQLYRRITQPAVNCCAFSSDGHLLACGDGDRVVHVWDLADGKRSHVLRGHSNKIRSLAFNSDGTVLASGDWDKTVKLWRLHGSSDHVDLSESKSGHRLEDMAFRDSDNQIVSLTLGLQSLKVWDRATATCLHDHSFPVIKRRRALGAMAAISPKGSRLAAIGADDPHTLVVWNIDTQEELQRLNAHESPASHLYFSGDGVRLTSAESKNSQATINVWDAATGASVFKHQVACKRLDRLALNSKGKLLAASMVLNSESTENPEAPGDHLIRVWSVDDGMKKFDAKSKWRCFSLAFSPDERTLALADVRGQLSLWQISNGNMISMFETGPAFIENLAFSPDGKRVAGATRRQVALWDVASGDMVFTLQGKPQGGDLIFYPRVIFSKDGRHIAANQFDDTIRIWSGLWPGED